MSFNFNWDGFSDEFYDRAKLMLTTALNKGPRPDVVADQIEVHELNLGTIAPELNFLDITDLAEGKFRGMLKLTYEGDAYLVLRTQVQVNPVQIKSEISIHARRGILAAHQPLIMPMLLRISQLKLSGIISLVISPHNGVTLAFKNDPLQSVEVSSTFDGLGSVKSFLQNQIEDTLRNMFQEDLPKLVHSFSYKLNQPNVSLSSLNTTLSSTPTLSSAILSPRHVCSHSIDSRAETPSTPGYCSSEKNDSNQIGFYSTLESATLPNLTRSRHSFHPGLASRWGTPIHTPEPESPKPDYFSSRRTHQRTFSFPRTQTAQAYHKVGPLPLQVKSPPEQGLKSIFSP